VSLSSCRVLLGVLIPSPLSVPTLGRRTQAAGVRAGALLTVLDELARVEVRQAAADEIYVKAPVLMVVEPESLCWITGRLTEEVSGVAWAQEFEQLPNLDQVMRDGGCGLAKGVALVNAARQKQGQALMVDQEDHFHALCGGSVGLQRARMRASKALAVAEQADRELAECTRQMRSRSSAASHSRATWNKAEAAMDVWCEMERVWNKTKAALPLFTSAGELNTRQQAEAVLAETLPQLPDCDFAKTKRQLQKPEILAFLDHVHEQLEVLPFEAAVKQAAVDQEGLRRRPELLQGESPAAAARRGVLLACAVILTNAGEVGAQAVSAIRNIFRTAYRASSLVECINSVLRMQQARHRKMTQGLLDLKRLYWNSHQFRTGRRRGTSPYQRLGVPWPEGLPWWNVLKLTPEQLRDKLSATKMAA
jgi:hypothetical protein